jgi:spore coat-associated protein N
VGRGLVETARAAEGGEGEDRGEGARGVIGGPGERGNMKGRRDATADTPGWTLAGGGAVAGAGGRPRLRMGEENSELPGGDGVLRESGASELPGGGMDALYGSGTSKPSGGTGASPGDDAPAARGGGVAVGVGGAPPAPFAGGGRHRRTLGALALGLCAVGLAVGSGADFSAQTANPSNVFSAGSLNMQNSKDGTAILNATGLKPGAAPKTGIVDIQNTGSISGRFTFSRDQLENTDSNNDNPTPFATKVVIGVVDCGQFATTAGPYGPIDVTPTCGDQDDRTVSLGPLSGQNGDIELGTYDAGEKHRYDFEASLDSSAGNEYSGDGSSARYLFDAKQMP